jgi:hypothetical protein
VFWVKLVRVNTSLHSDWLQPIRTENSSQILSKTQFILPTITYYLNLSAATMSGNYFEHLAEYALAVCRKCRHGILPSQIISHLQRTHQVKRKQAEVIAEEVSSWVRLIEYASELEVPSQVIQALHQLLVYADGLMCLIQPGHCYQIFRSEHAIRNHWRTVHDWSAAGKGGRPSQVAKTKIQDRINKGCKTVYCQRLLVQGHGSQYFEVQPPSQDQG